MDIRGLKAILDGRGMVGGVLGTKGDSDGFVVRGSLEDFGGFCLSSWMWMSRR